MVKGKSLGRGGKGVKDETGQSGSSAWNSWAVLVEQAVHDSAVCGKTADLLLL